MINATASGKLRKTFFVSFTLAVLGTFLTAAADMTLELHQRRPAEQKRRLRQLNELNATLWFELTAEERDDWRQLLADDPTLLVKACATESRASGANKHGDSL